MIVYKNIELEGTCEEWDVQNLDHLCFYLREVVKVFEDMGFDANNCKPVVVLPGFESPMCSDKGAYHIIYLTAREAYWCQYMYQLAHEYCHHIINGPLDGAHISSFWFEESVCEMASQFFLMRIALKWLIDETTYGGLGSFRNGTLSYAENIRRRNVVLNVPLSEWIRGHIGALTTTETGEIEAKERSLYKVIASEMLPLFERHPELWSILPLLKRIPQEDYVSFEHWITKIVEPNVRGDVRPAFEILKNKLLE